MERLCSTRQVLLADRAARQHGVISRDQLVELGFSASAIDKRLRTGRLHRVFRGAYAVGQPLLPNLGRAHAAVLSCGAHALLSHRSAAELWGLSRTSRYVIDVTVPRRLRGQRGICVHHTRTLHPDDVAELDGIPVTSVARTLLDYAETTTPRWLHRAWDQAERRELLDLDALDALLTRSPGRRGLKPLVALIATATAPEPTRSELEDMFRDLCVAHGIPIPVFNASVAGEEVDAYWPRHEFVVELDGWEHHKTRADRERDLLKAERIKLAGYQFMRFSYRRVANHPEEVASVIRRCLGMVPILG